MKDSALRTTATVIEAPVRSHPAGSRPGWAQHLAMGYETPNTIDASPNVTTGAILLLADR